MTWEQKVEMIRLFNQDRQKDAQDFCEPLLDTMDVQGYDMLFTALELTEANIAANKPFFDKLSDKISNHTFEFGFRTALRIEYFKLLNQQPVLQKENITNEQ